MNYPEIIIIVGTGRSGTSYLAKGLLKCFGLSISGEPKFVVPMYRQLWRFGDLSKPRNLSRLIHAVHGTQPFVHMHDVRGIPSTEAELWSCVEEPTYTGVLYAAFGLLAKKCRTRRLAYKDPSDVVHLPLLLRLMPTARFVHIIRDGRDVALSLLRFEWGPTNLFTGSRFWAKRVTKARKDGRSMPDRYLELRMEDLVLSTEQTANRIGHFLNRGAHLEQTEQLVNWVNRTKRPDRVWTWHRELTRDERWVCEAAAGETLRSFGYETEFGSRARVTRTGAMCYLGADIALRAKRKLMRTLNHK